MSSSLRLRGSVADKDGRGRQGGSGCCKERSQDGRESGPWQGPVWFGVEGHCSGREQTWRPASSTDEEDGLEGGVSGRGRDR